MRFATILIAVGLWAMTVNDAAAFGALAYGKARDGAPVIALITRPDAARAERDALAVCERMGQRRGGFQTPCRIARTFENRCYAAVSDNRNRVFVGTSINENYWARVRAQDECRRAGGGASCRVVRSVCDRTPGRPVAPPQGQGGTTGGRLE